jgi:predicted aspartyl protease
LTIGGDVGAFALPLVLLLAQAEPLPGSVPDVAVPPPREPIRIRPVALEHVDVVGEEPRYAAPTSLDRIGRVWAPVEVNGRGPYRLVLATGASHSALSPRLAEALGLHADPSHTVILRGATGSATVPMVPVESLEIGDLLMEPRQLAVIPDALGGADGVLGMDELANMRIHIDFRRDRITIMRSKNQRAGREFQTIPVKFLKDRLLAASASLGGVPVQAIIDTGGQSTLGNVALRLALAERRKKGIQEGKLDQVFGATLDMQVGTRLETPTLMLGEILVRNPAMTFADFEIFKHWKLTEEPAMLIGMDVLGLLDTLIIDYRRKELQVKLPRR